VNYGPSIANNCDATGTGLTDAVAGKLSYIDIQSRDINGAVINNIGDDY
jgi:hypothetical protein